MKLSSEESVLERLRFLQQQVKAGREEYRPLLEITVRVIQGHYTPRPELYLQRKSAACDRYAAKLKELDG